MNMPIQAAPIDRANRVANQQARSSGTVTLSASPVCPICNVLPPPFDTVCKLVFCS